MSSSFPEDEKSIFYGSLGFWVKVEVEGLERMFAIGYWSESVEVEGLRDWRRVPD